MTKVAAVAVSSLMLLLIGFSGKDQIYSVIWLLLVIAFLLASLIDKKEKT